ncbi:MAG: hypothetical protein DME04_11925 [Candidatus Rokuibacteriota bacterium]|nr:MAG: hypothetical protein DME04_11925 [Candidatus Rokubacteria bacterium]
MKVDVIVVQSGEATQATQQATKIIPIVMSLVMDPVGSGIVASLARPGGETSQEPPIWPLTWSGSSWS